MFFCVTLFGEIIFCFTFCYFLLLFGLIFLFTDHCPTWPYNGPIICNKNLSTVQCPVSRWIFFNSKKKLQVLIFPKTWIPFFTHNFKINSLKNKTEENLCSHISHTSASIIFEKDGTTDVATSLLRDSPFASNMMV